MVNKKSFRKYAVTTMVAATAAVVPAAVSADTTEGFKDVTKDNVHYDSIMALANAGVIDGYGDGTFRPFKEVTRVQVANMLADQLNLEPSADVAKTLEKFSDVDVTHEYAENIAAVVEAEIFSGDKEGNFNPWKTTTRQQMASVLVEALDLDEQYDGRDVKVALDQVDPEHEGAVQTLANLEITDQYGDKEDNNYKGYKNVNRGVFSSFLDRSNKVIEDEASEVESISAMNPNTIEVTFEGMNEPVEIELEEALTDGENEVTFEYDGNEYTVTVEFDEEAYEEAQAVQEATTAVEKAEGSLKQADVDAAQELVTDLSKSDDKTLLNARIAEVEQDIADVVDEVKNAGNQVTLYTALNQAPFENVDKNNIEDYSKIISDLEEYSVASIQDAINTVNETALEDDINAADNAVSTVNYDTQSEEDFNEAVKAAQDAIDALPSDFVAEGDETPLVEQFQAELDEQKSLYSDYVNKVTPVVDGKDQIAKFEALQANFKNAVVDNIGEYNFERMTTVEAIQNEVDEVNAQQAVNGLTGEDLTQENIDAAQKLVDRLTGSVEDDEADGYNATKAGFVEDIKTAQDDLDAEGNLADVTETVEALTTENEDGETVLADGVDQEAIDVVQKEVTNLGDGEEKTALQDLLDEAQDLLDVANLEAATEAIDGLTDDEGDLLADQADIDAAQDLLDATADDADTEGNLQDAIDAAQELLDTAAINTATTATELQTLLVNLGNETYNNLTTTQRGEVAEILFDRIPEDGFENTDAVSTVLTNAINAPEGEDVEAGYFDLLGAVNNADSYTTVRDALGNLDNDEFNALSPNEKLVAAENVLNDKPEDGYTSISQIVNNF